jgi:hypothetical protein
METLLFNIGDPGFYDEELLARAGAPQAQKVIEKEEDECECSCGVTDDVEPLDGHRFRVLAPIFLTPFGPSGPRLTMGQIIEAEPVSTGVWRYVRTHFKPAVRSWCDRCGQDVLNKPDIFKNLQLLRELNCNWEWCAGNITVQTMEGQPLLSEVERIIDRLFPKLQQAR